MVICFPDKVLLEKVSDPQEKSDKLKYFKIHPNDIFVSEIWSEKVPESDQKVIQNGTEKCPKSGSISLPDKVVLKNYVFKWSSRTIQ